MSRMIKLNSSNVVFLEQEHRYMLGFQELSGVTSILRQVLFPNKYADIDPDILNAAAERGTHIHEMIQAFEIGRQTPEGKYIADAIECLCRWQEQKPYTLGTMADEYLVSNERDIASKIDLVQYDAEGRITLADIKTTSTYDAEYLSWQLSIYAFLFELQNPELKVSQLLAYWFHRDTDRHWIFEALPVSRKTDAEVEELFQWWRKGEVHDIQAAQEPELPVQVIDIAAKYAELNEEIEALTKTRDEFRDGLLNLMREYGIEKFKTEGMSVCRIPATTRISFDSARFKAEQGEMYKRYEKSVPTRETIKITIRTK